MKTKYLEQARLMPLCAERHLMRLLHCLLFLLQAEKKVPIGEMDIKLKNIQLRTLQQGIAQELALLKKRIVLEGMDKEDEKWLENFENNRAQQDWLAAFHSLISFHGAIKQADRALSSIRSALKRHDYPLVKYKLSKLRSSHVDNHYTVAKHEIVEALWRYRIKTISFFMPYLKNEIPLGLKTIGAYREAIYLMKRAEILNQDLADEAVRAPDLVVVLEQNLCHISEPLKKARKLGVAQAKIQLDKLSLLSQEMHSLIPKATWVYQDVLFNLREKISSFLKNAEQLLMENCFDGLADEMTHALHLKKILSDYLDLKQEDKAFEMLQKTVELHLREKIISAQLLLYGGNQPPKNLEPVLKIAAQLDEAWTFLSTSEQMGKVIGNIISPLFDQLEQRFIHLAEKIDAFKEIEASFKEMETLWNLFPRLHERLEKQFRFSTLKIYFHIKKYTERIEDLLEHLLGENNDFCEEKYENLNQCLSEWQEAAWFSKVSITHYEDYFYAESFQKYEKKIDAYVNFLDEAIQEIPISYQEVDRVLKAYHGLKSLQGIRTLHTFYPSLEDKIRDSQKRLDRCFKQILECMKTDIRKTPICSLQQPIDLQRVEKWLYFLFEMNKFDFFKRTLAQTGIRVVIQSFLNENSQALSDELYDMDIPILDAMRRFYFDKCCIPYVDSFAICMKQRKNLEDCCSKYDYCDFPKDDLWIKKILNYREELSEALQRTPPLSERFDTLLSLSDELKKLDGFIENSLCFKALYLHYLEEKLSYINQLDYRLRPFFENKEYDYIEIKINELKASAQRGCPISQVVCVQQKQRLVAHLTSYIKAITVQIGQGRFEEVEGYFIKFYSLKYCAENKKILDAQEKFNTNLSKKFNELLTGLEQLLEEKNFCAFETAHCSLKRILSNLNRFISPSFSQKLMEQEGRLQQIMESILADYNSKEKFALNLLTRNSCKEIFHDLFKLREKRWQYGYCYDCLKKSLFNAFEESIEKLDIDNKEVCRKKIRYLQGLITPYPYMQACFKKALRIRFNDLEITEYLGDEKEEKNSHQLKIVSLFIIGSLVAVTAGVYGNDDFSCHRNSGISYFFLIIMLKRILHETMSYVVTQGFKDQKIPVSCLVKQSTYMLFKSAVETRVTNSMVEKTSSVPISLLISNGVVSMLEYAVEKYRSPRAKL